MATPQQVSMIVKYRALGWSQQEIADEVGLSRQTVAYQLKCLKNKSKEMNADDLLMGALIGGMAGFASGIILSQVLEQLDKKK